MTIKELEDQIRNYNVNYRKGNSLISDSEYDALFKELQEKDPENDLFKVGVIESLKDFQEYMERMEKLPIPMYSLEKVKSVEELKKFISNNWNLQHDDKIIITPKYDGISLCVNEKEKKAWTRGDGSKGQRSDEHYKKVNPLQTFPSHITYTFGEAIFKTEVFLANKGEYKSARNCVAGLFNSPEVSEMLSHVSYVRYGTDREDLDKSVQLSELEKVFQEKVTPYWVTTAFLFMNDGESILKFLNNIFEKITEYKCDGLVIEVDKASIRNKLGRLPNGNPRYTIAYKNESWSERAETIVREIEWNVSKDGKVKPVLIFDPVDLCGATVRRATAYNAKYLYDNNICEGASIIIARSGDVIPKHLKTLHYDSKSLRDEMDKSAVCPSCGETLKWDGTMTELVCTNSECKDKKIQKLVFFFSTLGTEEFREPTIRKIYDAGYETVKSILEITPAELTSIEGIGESLSKKLREQFNAYRDSGVPFARLLTALNVFEGTLGEKTCQLIFNNLISEDLDKVCDLEEIPLENLTAIKGISEITAMAFNKGIKTFSLAESFDIGISCVAQRVIETTGDQMSICFSGFRNKEWETALSSKGHKLVNSVSKNTSILVVKDKEGTSSKIKKAQELGISILSLSEFEKLLVTL